MEKEIKKQVYVPIPSTECYYGITVDKDTKLTYENKHVKQSLENLVLHTELTVETEYFKSVTNTDLKLMEGSIILLEEEGRGWFLPKDTRLGSIDEAIEELNFLKEQISKIKD